MCSSGPNDFNSTVTFAGTAGASGTSAAFTHGVLNSFPTLTPTVAGGGKTITATSGSIVGTTTITTVNPAVLDHYSVTFSGTPFYQGIIFTTLVTAKDVYENTVTTDSTTWVTNTSTSLNMMWNSVAEPLVYNNGTVPGDEDHARRQLSSGVATFLTKDNVLETGNTITVTDANLKTGTSAPIDISIQAGSYRSAASGNWGDLGTWESWDGSSLNLGGRQSYANFCRRTDRRSIRPHGGGRGQCYGGPGLCSERRASQREQRQHFDHRKRRAPRLGNLRNCKRRQRRHAGY